MPTGTEQEQLVWNPATQAWEPQYTDSVTQYPVVPVTPAATSNYADFFALMPGDNSSTVALGAAVQFPQDGYTSLSSTIVRASASTFTLPTVGNYEVIFQVSVTEAGQLSLAIGGVGLPNTVVGRATGTSQIFGHCVISTSVINEVLSVINPPGNSTALTITPIAGGTASVSATLFIRAL